MNCGDLDPCTVDTCVNGTCFNAPIICNDLSNCTTDACINGACVYTPIVCQANNLCEIASCDPRNGSCIVFPVICDDGNNCTIDSCANGVCSYIPRCASRCCGLKARLEFFFFFFFFFLKIEILFFVCQWGSLPSKRVQPCQRWLLQCGSCDLQRFEQLHDRFLCSWHVRVRSCFMSDFGSLFSKLV